MIHSIIENVRSWFRKLGNGANKESSPEEAAAPATKEKGEIAGGQRRISESRESDLERRKSRSRRRPRRRGPRKEETPLPEREAYRPEPFIALEEPWDPSEFQVPEEEGKTRFHDLDLPNEIMHGIYDLGFQYCTPIQSAILPQAIQGADAAGKAQTGTGKSAVFLITILAHLLTKPSPEKRRRGTPRALILAPTRELVLQIEKDARALAKYTPVKIVSVFGGMDYEKQKRSLTSGLVDVVMATPGRLLDFLRQGDIHLGNLEILIIDEADRMLDMGFIPDVQRIIRSTPPKANRQTMLFSATLTPEVTRFASQWTRDPVMVEIEPEHVAADTVEQIIYITTTEEKFALLYNIITLQKLDRVIVFGNRRDLTRKLTEKFRDYGISCALLSGEVDQKKRIRTLEDFRAGKIRVLVATDVAARGLHVDAVSHVINYNLPLDPEDYVHRIGRTGRAGASGISISFASEDDAFQIPAIEKFLGTELHCIHPEDEWLVLPPKPEGVRARPQIPRSSQGVGNDRRLPPGARSSSKRNANFKKSGSTRR
ncbi:hypothetical protein DAMNIGENAA_29440 [Desulforhabdus amnigena]|uniref:ATP-dependent RNA helicase RhlB n=1 Tax=Desulforhabdus amnigena TaxID=40218 RepID=A0A9W6FV74_9BACT|nr:DEAD/DEAH box helicase [Desulforhabdus amnigena]GLI35511.1 hypothetical protein DAMNIGENAA_29440 [Desulforhabdus amnigena]